MTLAPTRTPPLTPRIEPEQFAAPMTWEGYLALGQPEGLRIEFEDGRLLVSPSGTPPHDMLTAILLGLFELYEQQTRSRHCVSFAPHSFFMPPGDRDYQPDVGVITDARRGGPFGKRTEGAPNIAIEVLSPSTAARDRGVKAQRYHEQGTLEYSMRTRARRSFTAEAIRDGSRSIRRPDVTRHRSSRASPSTSRPCGAGSTRSSGSRRSTNLGSVDR